jgi:predicted permease
MGCNIGFTYPILLSVPSLAKAIFPVVLVWDLAGNLWIVMCVNYVVAIQYSPLHEDTQPLTSQSGEAQTGDISPATIGAVSEIDVTVSEGAESAAAEGCPRSLGNASQEGRSNRSAVHKSMTRSSSAFFAASALMEAGVVSSARTSEKNGVGLREILFKLFTNIPLVAMFVALLINKSGAHLPKPMHDILYNLGQPFNVLFFFLIGLNTVWLMIRPRLGLVAKIMLVRITIYAFLAAGIWSLPFLTDPAMRHGALFGLCCPVSGMVMSFVIDLGYNRGLQAALQTCTNVTSLAALWFLLSLF